MEKRRHPPSVRPLARGFRFCFYDARLRNIRLGRVMSPDPLGCAAQLNFYAYVGDALCPVVDPIGMTAEVVGNRANGSFDLLISSPHEALDVAGLWPGLALFPIFSAPVCMRRKAIG